MSAQRPTVAAHNNGHFDSAWWTTFFADSTKVELISSRSITVTLSYRRLYQLVDNEYAELWIFNEFTIPRTAAFESDAILNNKLRSIRLLSRSIRNYVANSIGMDPNDTLKF